MVKVVTFSVALPILIVFTAVNYLMITMVIKNESSMTRWLNEKKILHHIGACIAYNGLRCP